MKISLSILLSFSLLITGVPIAGQEKAVGSWKKAAVIEQQAQSSMQEEETEMPEEGTDVPKENPKERKEQKENQKEQQENSKELKENQKEQKEEKSGENPDIHNGSEDYGKKEARRTEQEEDALRQKEKGLQEKEEVKENSGRIASPPKIDGEKSADSEKKAKAQKSAGEKFLQQKDGQLPETAENAAETRAAAASEINVHQDKVSKCLQLLDGEMVHPGSKIGYHTAVSRKVNCIHTSLGFGLGSIKCNKAASPLNPTRAELSANVKLTGTLRGKKIAKKKITSYNPGGTDNTVSHLQVEAEVQAPGTDGTNLKQLVAGPYVCAGDGYAGYAYFEKHYSYCPNTERYYKVGESHVWLGCTKDRDGGNNEFHASECRHQFSLYKYVPNNYKVRYDANGGTGTVAGQNATYGKEFTLRAGSGCKRTGHTLTGWNTKADGTGHAYGFGEAVKNLTTENGGIVMLYAQWRPNRLTVRYNGNGGKADWKNAAQVIGFYADGWPYGNARKDPADFSLFGLSRLGHSRKDGAEWNTRADGAGRSFDQDVGYLVTDYAPGLVNADQDITLYAQWEPNTYTVTLDHRLREPDKAGTGKIYKKYTKGMYLDSACRQSAAEITPPQKEGYKFKGYYDLAGKPMADSNGRLTGEAKGRKDEIGDETWNARYGYLIRCEDYADIPCDLGKTPGDSREDPGVRLTYDGSARMVAVQTEQPGCDISLIAQPQGTKVGEMESSLAAGSAAGNTGALQEMKLLLNVPEGAAYRLIVEKGGRTLCNRLVYYRGGRFRTLVKLGEQKAKEAEPGSSIAGSDWKRDGQEGYSLYRYYGCSELKNIQEPGSVCRYFRYKDVNMAYSGAEATEGRNTLECNVSLEGMYQFRDNEFKKERTEVKRTKNGEAYECKVKYSFQGWGIKNPFLGWNMQECSFEEKEQMQMLKVYLEADKIKAISDCTAEDISTYQIAQPIRVLPGIYGNTRSEQGTWEEALKTVQPGKTYTEEYINLVAKWDACPTIVVAPGEKLEFYEGEEVTKEDLISHLTAHDSEDNHKNNEPYVADLDDKLRIVKVSYPEPKNRSQAAYEETFEEDVPAGFLLNTYYLKLEEDETVDVLITFAVTDSAGNTTEEEIPVKIKYNNYPEISSEDTFYYLKEEANRGEITAETLIGRAAAEDIEDGDISGKLEIKDFDAQAIKLQTESKAEFSITYQVTDAYRKTSYKTVKLMVWDGDAAAAEMPKYYVRYISEKYLDTLEENSVWRKPENLAYLKSILRNEMPMEVWEFTHEDVLAVQGWITEEGEGNWKTGQAANQEFLARFAHCRQ